MPGVTEPIAKIMSPLPRHARRSQRQLSKILIRVLQVSKTVNARGLIDSVPPHACKANFFCVGLVRSIRHLVPGIDMVSFSARS